MILTTQQLQTIKAAILADPVLSVQPHDGNGNGFIADAFNAVASPAFTVFKSSVTLTQVGLAMLSSDVANLTTANTNRLTVIAAFSGGMFYPAIQDTWDGFNSVFSVSGASGTRAALLALRKRFASRIEALLATGTGSDAVPAFLTVEGTITSNQIDSARNTA